jgi:hypothetical protein
MPGAPYYAQAFSPLPGRCFRLVAHHGEAGPTHCPEPVAWRGSWGARTAAATGSRPAKATGRHRSRAAVLPPNLAAGFTADAQVQVHPAALPLDLIDLALAVVLTTSLEGEQLGVPRERLEGGQHVSYGHAPSVATAAR